MPHRTGGPLSPVLNWATPGPSDAHEDMEVNVPAARHRQSTLQRVTELFGNNLTDHSLVSVKKLGHLQNKHYQKQMLVSMDLLEETEHARTVCKESIRLLSVWDKHQVVRRFAQTDAKDRGVSGAAPSAFKYPSTSGQPQAGESQRPESPQHAQGGARRRSGSPAQGSQLQGANQTISTGLDIDVLNGPVPFSAEALYSDLLEQHPGSPINDQQVRKLGKADTRHMLNAMESVLQDAYEAPLVSHARAHVATSTRSSFGPGAPGPLSPKRETSPRHLHTLPLCGVDMHSSSKRVFSPRQVSPRMRSPLATCRSKSPTLFPPSASVTRPSTGSTPAAGLEEQPSFATLCSSVPGHQSARSSMSLAPLPNLQPSQQTDEPSDSQSTPETTQEPVVDLVLPQQQETQTPGLSAIAEDDYGITRVAGRIVVQYSGAFPNSHTARQDALARNVPPIVLRNAAGYVEDVAAAEVAGSRDAAERARTVLLQTHLLPADELRHKALRGSVQELHYRRPYFLPKASDAAQVLVREPGVLYGLRAARKLAVAHGEDAIPEVEASASSSTAPGLTAQRQNKAWTPEMSVFAPRLVESDAQALNDGLAVRERQLGMDWRRIAMKDAFRHWVAGSDPSIRTGFNTLDKVLSAIQTVLHSHCDTLRAVFTYYACAGHEEGRVSLLVTQQQWKQLLSDCRVTPGVKAGPVESVFVTSCSGSSESLPEGLLVEAHNKLMRFEFYEAIIRMAATVYPVPHKAASIADALQEFVTQDIKAHVPTAALHLPSAFREQRLYTQEVDAVLRTAGPVLHALYTCACASAGSHYLHVDQWQEMLSMAGVLGDHVGLNAFTAALAATWSQMIVVDEIQRRHRAASMDLQDMCEALARVADIVSPPPAPVVHATLRNARLLDKPELETAAAEHPYHTYYTLAEAHRSRMCFTRRRSAGLLKPRSRPLADKLSGFLDLFITGTCNSWGVPDSESLIAKLKYVTTLMLQQGWGDHANEQQA